MGGQMHLEPSKNSRETISIYKLHKYKINHDEVIIYSFFKPPMVKV